jgi:uncharacterized membrane protein
MGKVGPCNTLKTTMIYLNIAFAAMAMLTLFASEPDYLLSFSLIILNSFNSASIFFDWSKS